MAVLGTETDLPDYGVFTTYRFLQGGLSFCLLQLVWFVWFLPETEGLEFERGITSQCSPVPTLASLQTVPSALSGLCLRVPGRWVQWFPHPGSSLLPLKLELSAPPLSPLALQYGKLSHCPLNSCQFLFSFVEALNHVRVGLVILFFFFFFQLISPAWKSFSKVKCTLNPRNYLEKIMARPSSVL